MSKEWPQRQFDIREGKRDHNITVRVNKRELEYIEKMAKKLKISRGALILQHVNEFRTKAEKKESK